MFGLDKYRRDKRYGLRLVLPPIILKQSQVKSKKIMPIKVEVGQIWEVSTDTFFTSGDKDAHKRPTKLKQGERIEIRYPYAWHFRTEDNIYLHCSEEMLIQNAFLFGIIDYKVRQTNKATLYEILRLSLFEYVK
jgi:hypothetical protein